MKKISLFLTIGIFMTIAAIVFVIFALNNSQFSFLWNNTIAYGIYVIYGMAMSLLILMGLISKNVKEDMKLLLSELKKGKNIVLLIFLIILLTIPLYGHVYHGFLYYIIVVFICNPFAFYRIMRSDSLEKKFYYKWEKRREKGRLANAFSAGFRAVVQIVIFVLGCQFIVNGRTPGFILSKLPVNVSTGLIAFLLLLGAVCGIAEWNENEKRYAKLSLTYNAKD